MSTIDPVALAQSLIRCPSVTPADAGAIGVLEETLKPLGFTCHRLRFEQPGTAPIENLYARFGTSGPNFCFAGHTDVVPPGDLALWRANPFAAEIRDGVLYGRGAADMKSAVAAFVAAAARAVNAKTAKGSISLLITGDEEGPSVNGTPKLLGWLKARGEKIDHCIVGEPTSVAVTGDTIKIGRRGSIGTRVSVRGVQGHVGYPREALNPIPPLAALITRLSSHTLDRGNGHFDPSTLAFTTVDVGNPATNVIPAEAHAVFNIRFNNEHTAESLERWIETEAEAVAREFGCEIAVRSNVSGVAFLTEPGAFTALIAGAIERTTGQKPKFSTSGGTSDARFIKDHCPVAEFGLAGKTMHKVDECAPVKEIESLTDIYANLIGDYFANPPG
jgi:succinyl-diaminopimelate desuccinylase